MFNCSEFKPATLIGYRRDSFLKLCIFICFPNRISIISFKNAYWDLKRRLKHMALLSVFVLIIIFFQNHSWLLNVLIFTQSDFRFSFLELTDWSAESSCFFLQSIFCNLAEFAFKSGIFTYIYCKVSKYSPT